MDHRGVQIAGPRTVRRANCTVVESTLQATHWKLQHSSVASPMLQPRIKQREPSDGRRNLDAGGAQERKVVKSMTQAPRIIVVGCGSLGAHLVERIAKKGWQVAVIDRNADAFSSLPNSFTAPRFVGDPMEPTVMEEASAGEAQLVVATTPDDNLNVAIGITAKRVFGVEHAVARVFDVERSKSLAQLRVDTVCPTLLETAVVVRRVEQVTRTSELPILVAGCGRLGSHLANLFCRSGHHVIVVDNRPSSFDRLDRAFAGRRVAGDATDPAVLERAGAKEVGLGIVAIRDDNVSLMIARVGKRVFGLEELLARVHDPRREATFEGVDTLSSTVISADAVMRALEHWVGVSARGR